MYVIIELIKIILEKILLEFVVDIMEKGIMFVGGGVYLRGLDVFINKEINMFVYIVEVFFDCVVFGVGKVFEDFDKISRD